MDLEDGWDFHIDPQGKGHPNEEKPEAGKERGAKAVASAQRTQGVKGGMRKTEQEVGAQCARPAAPGSEK